LAQALTTARDAISEQNFTAAESELAKADGLAKSDKLKEKVQRLRLLLDTIRQFRAAINETVQGFGAGDQVTLDANRSFGVVEVTPDRLVIRFSGKNYPYPMNDLPLGLATRLAEMSLAKDDPATLLMKAAFVSLNPKADDDNLAKARTWWEQVASADGAKDLQLAIKDDYSLKEDLAGIALDQKTMEQVAAQSDRLNGSTKLEDYASEYQAAIDESLKTLKAGTEILVGASTTITVQELKKDRVIVEVADVRRGFQYTKLPLGLAAAIAERTLPKDVPLTMVMKGAYYAAREKDSKNKQFRGTVLAWWKEAGETDPQLQPLIQELVKQYPE